jgi:hypothetical protein
MFSFRTKLLLFLAIIITVVILAWLYAQQTYSAFNLTEPSGPEIPNLEDIGTRTAISFITPTSTQILTVSPTTAGTAQGDTGCTLPLVYWLQNQTKIPPQILVNVSGANQTGVCVNYAQIEICADLGESSTSPDVILRQQFLVAIMNYLSGADAGAISSTINEAYEWLRSHLSAASILEEEMQAARLYAETLRSYNLGEIGPGACELEIIPMTQQEIPTSSPTVSDAIAVSSPTAISTPTPRRTAIIIVPTSTERPNQEPEPTLTPQPLPTDTDVVPATIPPPSPTSTEIPPATSTEIPPATSTSLPSPTPVSDDATPTPVP